MFKLSHHMVLLSPITHTELGKDEKLCSRTFISLFEKQAISRNIWPEKYLHAVSCSRRHLRVVLKVTLGS